MNVPQFAASIERDAEGRVVSVFCNGDLMGMLYELTEDEAKALCYLLNHYQERVHALVSEGERVGAAAERARIVEWLRATGGAFRFVTCDTACHGGERRLRRGPQVPHGVPVTAADRTEIEGPAFVQVVGNVIDVRTGEPFRWRHRMASVRQASVMADAIRMEHPEWTVLVEEP